MKAPNRALCSVLALLLILAVPALAQPKIPSPSEFLGFTVGADRTLADYRQISKYFGTLAAASDRIELETLGKSTLGEDMIMAIISSAENLKNKDHYKEIAKKIADPRGSSPSEIDNLVKEGKAVILITCNIHATEIASTQMAMEWAYDLATTSDPAKLQRLNDVILLLVPSLNPDGQIMETEWYRKYLGTPYEGGRMPWLYHYYVGHDNNRDWYMLTQKETKAMTRAAFHEWYPQVWLDEHQMGITGPRMFVPPYANPVAKNLDPIIWRMDDHIGTLMSLRLEEAGKSGVIHSYVFDAYWPGGTKNTAWWKNMFGLLTEVASVKLATPVDVSPNELSGGGKGLIEYGQQTNFPNPWPGGVWRLRDIMDYELIASNALLEIGSVHREDLLRGVVAMAQHAVASESPDEYYVITASQRDPYRAARLAHLLEENGAEVRASQDGSVFYVPCAQPYAKFLEEVLNPQRYPKVKPVAGQDILPPYDVTAWTLPLMMGVDVAKVRVAVAAQQQLRPLQETDWPRGSVDKPGAAVYAVSPASTNAVRLINVALKQGVTINVADRAFEANGASYAAGTFLLESPSRAGDLAKSTSVALQALDRIPSVPLSRLKEPRVALYKPWLASMDEGWTRWVLDQYGFTYKNVDNKRIKEGKLNKEFDVLLLADINKDVIVDGKYKREEGQMRYFPELPPEYRGGIGKEGVNNLKEFVENGGTLVALASSSALVMDEFNIPVSNPLARARLDDFNCPGSLLRLLVDPSHPLGYGMPDTVAAFLDDRLVFRTAVPGSELTRHVVAHYPDDEEDILMSGWIKGAGRLARNAAAVALTYGKGKIALIGFRVQHRAQTEGTFKMLFNALYWGGMTPVR